MFVMEVDMHSGKIHIGTSGWSYSDWKGVIYSQVTTEYSQYDFVLEVRHATWLEQEAVDMLHHYKIGSVISQSGVGFPYSEAITSHIVYVRFHGPAKLYDSSYSDEQLNEYAVKFKKCLKEGKQVWVFFNNTMHGHGFHNAITLQEIMNKQEI